MKNIVVIFLSALCFQSWGSRSPVVPQGIPVGQSRGVAELQAIFNQRLFEAPSGVQLPSYFRESSVSSGMTALLGFSDNGTYQNGIPNALNSLVWQMLLKQFAGDIALHCSDKLREGWVFQRAMRTVLDDVCDWPVERAEQEAVLYELWISFTLFEVPFAEFEAWKDYFTSEYLAVSDEGRVTDLLFTVFYHPHFVLKH